MQQFNLSYKPHIDGLRAIAVIIVILFHLNPTVFAGGYLGVDMFFVISGFVITQSLYKEYQKQAEFCVFSFYVRRFKRIYPALVTVVVFTLIFYFIFGLLTQTQLILKSGITSIFAISNLFFLYQGADYFDDNIFNPLSHTWSLGIEEQFYFSYPFLLAIGLGAVDRFKLKFGVLPIAIIFFSITSYLIFCLEGDSIFGSFFFPTARFWELGVGCFLFLSSLNFLAFQKFTNIASIIAIGLFFYLQIYPQTIHNLYIETLLAVLAVSLIIHSQIGEENGEIVGLLKHRTVVYLGKISYSLYLWHLPVIYFSKVYLDTVLFYAITPLIIIGLAVLSYHIIEKPFRYSSIFDRAVKVSVFVLPASFMVIILSLPDT